MRFDLIDAMVYELYFPDEIKAAGCEVLKHPADLPELKNNWNDEQKLAAIEKVYLELSDLIHPVFIAMTKMHNIPEVKYPAAMAGQDRANFLRGNFEVLTRGAIRIVEGNI